jgi:hypothetical protein
MNDTDYKVHLLTKKIQALEQRVEALEQRTWVGLTKDEHSNASWTDGSFGAGARWAEITLKEKNV